MYFVELTSSILLMAKKALKKPSSARKAKETDGAYLLKIVMYFIFGTFWIHVSGNGWVIPIPLGFAVGMFFAMHDHFKIDRKIEYAVLLVAMFLTYFVAPRLNIQI